MAKKKTNQPVEMKEYDVTFTLKWDENIELCISKVKAPSQEKAYWNAITRIEEMNKREFERGRENHGPLIHMDIWKKQAKVEEIVKPEKSWLKVAA